MRSRKDRPLRAPASELGQRAYTALAVAVAASSLTLPCSVRPKYSAVDAEAGSTVTA